MWIKPALILFVYLNSGHKAYVGFLYLEHTYNNAVMNMFVTLMMNAVRAGRKDNVHGGNGDTCKLSFCF